MMEPSMLGWRRKLLANSSVSASPERTFTLTFSNMTDLSVCGVSWSMQRSRRPARHPGPLCALLPEHRLKLEIVGERRGMCRILMLVEVAAGDPGGLLGERKKKR